MDVGGDLSMNDLRQKILDLLEKVRDLEEKVRDLEDRLESEKVGRTSDRNEMASLGSELSRLRESYFVMAAIFTVENSTLRNMLRSPTERALCHERNAARQARIGELNSRLSTLEKEHSELLLWRDMDEEERKEEKSQRETEKSELRDTQEKLKNLEEKLEKGMKNGVVRQLALDLEWQIKVFLIAKMDEPQGSEYFYEDGDEAGNSLIRWRVDAMEYRDVVHLDRRLRLLLLQEYFQGELTRYRTFLRTMSSIKDLFNPGAHPRKDLDGNPINQRSILQFIEDSPLAKEHKIAAKEYALWQYPH